MITRPFVSIVIPSFNSSKYIERALGSLCEQTYKKFEVIVVDDNSADVDSLERIIFLYEKKLSIRLIKNNEKKNASFSRNVGANLAKGEYICFLDADDVFAFNKIEIQTRIMGYHDLQWSYTKLFHCKYSELSDVEKCKIKPKKGLYKDLSFYDYIFLHQGVIQTSTLMIRRDLIEFVQFNESIPRHQDYEYCFNLIEFGFKYKFIPVPLTYWILPEKYVSPISKNQSIEFCLDWIKKQNMSNNAKASYLLNNVILVGIKSRAFRSLFSFLFGSSVSLGMKLRVIATLFRYIGCKICIY